jgi:nucleoside-diphosphate-sugar epimerase
MLFLGSFTNFTSQKVKVYALLVANTSLSNLCSEEGKDMVMWGTGKPLRQFIYSLDLAKLFLYVFFSLSSFSSNMSLPRALPFFCLKKMGASKL